MILTYMYMYVTFFLTQWISDFNSLQVNSIGDSRKSPYPTTMALVYGSRDSVQCTFTLALEYKGYCL